MSSAIDSSTAISYSRTITSSSVSKLCAASGTLLEVLQKSFWPLGGPGPEMILPIDLSVSVNFKWSSEKCHEFRTVKKLLIVSQFCCPYKAFCVAAPSIWNSLPPELRLFNNASTFKRLLKTNLFDVAFNRV
jgi:hypothetical protein